MADESYDFTTVDVELEESEPIGVTLGLDMSVSAVSPDSPAQGQIRVRDHIVSINGEVVTSAIGFTELLRRHRSQLHISVFRPRPGYEYVHTQIDLPVSSGSNAPKSMSFGLNLKDHNNRVYAGRVDHDSLSYRAGVQNLDHIVHINGQKVTNKEAAKTAIVKCLKATKSVPMLLERAADAKTKSIAQQADRRNTQQPSVMMPSDVHRIVDQEQNRMQHQDPAATTNLLVAPGANDDNDQHVKIASQHNSVEIRNDHPDKKLKPVKKNRK